MTQKAIRRKIERNVWAEGIHFRRRDGGIFIDLPAVEKWVEPSACLVKPSSSTLSRSVNSARPPATSPATRDQYGNAARFWQDMFGSNTDVDTLTHAVLKAKIGGHPWASPKLLNNHLIALRGIFGLLYHGVTSAANPMTGILNSKVVKKQPDPLSTDERDSILADLAERYGSKTHSERNVYSNSVTNLTGGFRQPTKRITLKYFMKYVFIYALTALVSSAFGFWWGMLFVAVEN